MKLRQDKFNNPEELCDWVNDHKQSITIISIANNEFMDLVLFYTIAEESISDKCERFDVESMWEARMKNCRGDMDGSENQEE